MKSLFLVLALSLSSTAFARQYIQCNILGNSTDVAVVNLATPTTGTLFLSSGMQNPEDERVLLKIAFDKIEKNHHIYKVVSEYGAGSVSVPSDMIGKSTNSMVVDISFVGVGSAYGCFSRIYND